jgi:hypothetical protein
MPKEKTSPEDVTTAKDGNLVFQFSKNLIKILIALNSLPENLNFHQDN